MAESEGVPKHLLRPKGNELNVKLSIDTQYIYTTTSTHTLSSFPGWIMKIYCQILLIGKL